MDPRAELEKIVGGEPGKGGMNLWSAEMDDENVNEVEEDKTQEGLEADEAYDPDLIAPRRNKGVKVIFRDLPPNITEEDFLDVVGLRPEEYNYVFVKNPCSYRKINFEDKSVAFLNFTDPEMAEIYIEKFDGFMFLDKSGQDYYSSTALAPNQSIPKPIKRDPMMGTYLETEDFLNFSKQYAAMGGRVYGAFPPHEDGVEMSEAYLQELEEREKHPVKNESCPLVEYFREQRKLETTTSRRNNESDRRSPEKFRTTKKDKKDLERKERERRDRERERKDKRAKRKNKLDEIKEKRRNSLKEVQEESPEGKAENDGPDSKIDSKSGQSKDDFSAKTGGSKDLADSKAPEKPLKSSNELRGKPFPEKAPFSKKTNSSRSWDREQRGKGWGKGHQSYPNESPRRPIAEKAPQKEINSKTAEGDDNSLAKITEKSESKVSKSSVERGVDEKSWRSGPRGSSRVEDSWGKKSGNQRDRERSQRGWGDRSLKDREKGQNSNPKKVEEPKSVPIAKEKDTSKQTTTVAQKSDDSVPTGAKTPDLEENPAPPVKVLQRQNSDAPSEKSSSGKAPARKVVIKKIVKVRKVVSSRSEEAIEYKKSTESGDPLKSAIPKAKDGNPLDKPVLRKSATDLENATTTSADAKADDKDRRPRKGRPDIQIYRPGSWRNSCVQHTAKVESASTDRGTSSSKKLAG